MRVVIADKAEDSLIQGLERLGCTVTSDASLDGDTLAAALKDADALVVRSTKVPAEVLSGGEGSLRFVIRAGAGYDNIDCDAAAAKGIAVSNTPGMNAVAVAEIAMGHLINLDRRLCDQNAELKGGHWNKKKYSKAKGLKGRRLLVIGAGAIGRELISRARAFGMDVDAADVMLDAAKAEALGVGLVRSSRADLLEALPAYDAVSMHVPAIDETKGMCDAEFFGAMAEGSFFVNTSRGAIVDEAALAEAVSSGRIRAGLDVYNSQPSEKDVDWLPDIAGVDGVYCTHHCGASTDQSQNAIADEVVRMISVFKESGTVEHCVNGVA